MSASPIDQEVTERADGLFAEDRARNHRHMDRLFAVLMVAQWLFAIGLALVFSPYGWSGKVRVVHFHVYTAVFLGGAISSLPIALALLRPGRTSTRHLIAVAQMLWSALLIHLSGGRIETHFHVFGSLAFLAFYRDWRLLQTAVVVVAGDHFIRGIVWPESVYGVANPEWWRFLEHAFWVLFEDAFLVVACVNGSRDQRQMKRREAHVEVLSRRLEEAVEERTAQLYEAVTDYKQLQGRLILADRMTSVGTLAAGVAHEINNPLAYVVGNLDFAAGTLGRLVESLRNFPPPGAPPPADLASSAHRSLEEIGDALGDAREGATRVRNIVRDLKMFSRADEERHGPVDVRRVLESSINMAWNEIRHRARLVKDYQEVGPVEGNESRIGQLFLNLLVNAAQALPVGRAEQNEIRVRLATDPAGRVVVEVQDTGPGIAPEIRDRIFDPFFTTKPIGVGTGLGLSICHGIVTGMSGEIEVESEVGRGATFRVLFPLATQAVAEVARETSGPLEVRRRRVLLVDDEPMILSALRRSIQPHHDVVAVSSGREALERIAGGERYDVILCDLMMPELTGMDLHAELSRTVPDLVGRMVFVSGGAFTPAAKQFLDEVPNPRIEKPYDTRAVINLIASFEAAVTGMATAGPAR